MVPGWTRGSWAKVSCAKMLSLTRKTDYALVALVDLARRSGKMASARELAQRLHVPPRALTNVLNRLKHHGLVTSVRGSVGGYRLAKVLKEITLAELIEAVEGPVKLTRCCTSDKDADNRKCERASWCDLSESIQKVHAGFKLFLDQVTLDDLASNRVPKSVARPVIAPEQVCGQLKQGRAASAAGQTPLALDQRDREQTHNV